MPIGLQRPPQPDIWRLQTPPHFGHHPAVSVHPSRTSTCTIPLPPTHQLLPSLHSTLLNHAGALTRFSSMNIFPISISALLAASNTSWISQGCMNISTRSQFEAIVPVSARNDAASNCISPPFMQRLLPIGGGVGLLVLIGLFWIFHKRKKRADKFGRVLETELGSGLESISQSTSLVKYTFDEIRKATRNFSRDNIIGRGGYGNVYKGELPDGSLVAFKRFKNCSAAGDSTFTHEVEVIASVRHVNLVALRGYCTATSPFEGHQRIIALMVDHEGQPSIVTDWAWSLVRDGRTLDVIEDGMPELGSQEILEKYVLVAVLCSHPQLYARPTMDQVVKMLETDLSIPSIPERPIPLVAEMGDIERSLSNCASGQLSSPTGYQHFTFENDRPSICKEERSSSDSREIE
ncbi:hypothetical protein OIU84_016535 [Salix udensis]|uniref:Protein kinase domain-containing protein n=1 Tax=Salix udensis TaxID=889485 RepID=A0AAD6JAP7_9ROSI|nr:hypothetical protein OIU84_016535 [Salix udensis]